MCSQVKGLFSYSSFLVVAGLLLIATACGGGGGDHGSPPPPPVTISVAPIGPSVIVGGTQQFTATLGNTTNLGVTWALSGTGCSGSDCGTLSSTTANPVTYTAPWAVPNPATVTVKATSAEDPSKSASATVSLTAPAMTITTWPARAMVTVSATRQFSAVVLGVSNTSVTWSVSGSGCTAAACGTVSSSGLYTAPGTVPSPATVTVTAASAVDPSQSGSSTIQVVPTDTAKLNGHYAVLLQGFLSDRPAQIAAAFTADGAGNITAGVFDRTMPNAVGGNLINESITGTYQVFSDNRGEMQWSFSGGSMTLRFSLTASGDRAYLIPFYDYTVRLAGFFAKQDTNAFTATAINGDYVFQMTGADSSDDRLADVGRFHADGAGNISGGTLDINDGSTLSQNLTMSGTYTAGSDGRGLIQITIPTLGTFNFAGYVVSATELIMSSIDPIASGMVMQSGRVLLQSGASFSSSSLQNSAVFHQSGQVPGTGAVQMVGRITSDGSGNITVMDDQNVAGTITSDTAVPLTYSVSSNGRTLISSSGVAITILYLVDQNQGFLLGMDTGAGIPVLAGWLEPQMQMPYSTATMLGQVASGTIPPSTGTIQIASGVVYFDSAGSYNFMVDANWYSAGLSPDTAGSGSYTVDANGRVTASYPGGGIWAISYMSSPAKQWEINADPAAGPELAVIYSFEE